MFVSFVLRNTELRLGNETNYCYGYDELGVHVTGD